MSTTGYLIWFVVMAVAVTAILATGTLVALGLGGERASRRAERPRPTPAASPTRDAAAPEQGVGQHAPRHRAA
jgi:hypothetical protein